MNDAKGKLVAAVSAALIVSGCAVTPTVKYANIASGSSPKADWEGNQKFKFNASTILISKAKDEKGNEKPLDKGLSIVSVPAEDPRGNVIAIVPAGSLGVKTNLSLTARNNTMLVESIGVEVVDDRVKTIQTIGSIVGTVIGLLADIPVPDPYPIAVDVGSHLIKQQSMTAAKLEQTVANVKIEIEFGSLSADVIAWADFESRLGQDSNAFFYSACRDAAITVTGERYVHRATVRVADPMYLQTVRFPTKGKILMHSSCGVSVASESAKVSTDLELLDALIGQAKSIKDARTKAAADAAKGTKK